MSDFPTPDEVRELHENLRVVVPPEYADTNGHMNVTRYDELHAQNSGLLFDDLGVSQEYPLQRGLGVFTLSKQVDFLAEALVGDTLTLHTRLIGRRGPIAHILGFMVNQTRDVLASVMSVTGGHVDLSTRRMAPMPPDIEATFDKYIAISDALDWPAPVLRPVGLR